MKKTKLSSMDFQTQVNHEIGLLKSKKTFSFPRVTIKNFEGFDNRRIFHFHNRKTAGTSLNISFLSLISQNPIKKYAEIVLDPDHKITKLGKTYIGWNHNLAKSEKFFYSWSVEPFNKIGLDNDMFGVTILRDPADRIISLYDHFLYSVEKQVLIHPDIEKEVRLTQNGFTDFLKNLPKKTLMRQLFSFSERYDIEEAYNNVTKLSHVMFTSHYEESLRALSSKLDLGLKSYYLRKSSKKTKISDSQRRLLQKKLEPEYEFYNKIYKIRKNYL